MVDFNRDSMEGQMSPIERETMYNTICKYKPKTVFEIGTWKGGGSTYIISSALHDNGSGILTTIENYPEFYNHAVNLYNGELSYLKPYINFNLGCSVEIYTPILQNIDSVDFLLLDGAEDADQTVLEYNLFASKFTCGSIIMCHDWKTHKCEKIKTILSSDTWEQLFELDTSTGFSGFIHN